MEMICLAGLEPTIAQFDEFQNSGGAWEIVATIHRNVTVAIFF
jgi:hypothetical protein